MFGARATAAILTFAAVFQTTSARAAESAVAAPLAAAALSPPAITGYGPFIIDAKLEPRVRFWVDIYAKYHTYDALIVDIKFPQLIYSMIDTREKPGAIGAEKRHVAQALRSVADKWDGLESGHILRSSLKPFEQKIYDNARALGLGAELKAAADEPAKFLRAQNGLRDALEDSLFVSGKYLPRMQALFSRFHLPEDIAYLPFVESGFNKHAVSKVGASGIWQFMPYTGKLYLQVDDVVDERNDPMRAAEAAARLMKQNYDLLGDWPLAITAYNHGTTGVARAARDVGSRQISEIIDKFENKNFGFASQNFYACFLAALHVAKNSETYLGVVPRARKLEFDEFVMPDFMAAKDFLARMEIDETVFRELNPALTEEVYKGARLMPVGYTVRVPMEASAGFLGRYEQIPAAMKFHEQLGATQELRLPASVPAVENK
jgi:membrane-bound lytic murein transglycosylase D